MHGALGNGGGGMKTEWHVVVGSSLPLLHISQTSRKLLAPKTGRTKTKLTPRHRRPLAGIGEPGIREQGTGNRDPGQTLGDLCSTGAAAGTSIIYHRWIHLRQGGQGMPPMWATIFMNKLHVRRRRTPSMVLHSKMSSSKFWDWKKIGLCMTFYLLVLSLKNIYDHL